LLLGSKYTRSKKVREIIWWCGFTISIDRLP
jgi:hypothetical protein